MDLATIDAVLEILVKLTILAGIPIGLYKYFQTVRQEREQEEYRTFNAVGEQYYQFLQLCLEHPELDIFDTPAGETGLNDLTARKEMIAYTILISLFERAYLMYRHQAKPFRMRQWQGWENYMRDYVQRENFMRAWNTCGADDFDGDFYRFMQRIIQEENQKRMGRAEDQAAQKPGPAKQSGARLPVVRWFPSPFSRTAKKAGKPKRH